MGPQGSCDRRALGAVLAIALCLSVVVAWPASANFGGVFPTDEDGGTAIETIASNQNLFAYALTDVQGGDICIVPAALENPGNGNLNCLTPAWGSSNRVIGIGSTWTLIETPYLRAGHWKLLGDGGSKQSVDVFSNDFWVLPCEPGACDRRLAERDGGALQGRGGRDGGRHGRHEADAQADRPRSRPTSRSITSRTRSTRSSSPRWRTRRSTSGSSRTRSRAS